MDFKNLKTQTDGPIATVHFDRPDKANALNYEHLREIKQVCEQFQENDQVKDIDYPKGWSAGHTALHLACQEGAEEIYMLGFDGSDYSKPINNVYKGSKNYLPEDSRGFNTINWDNQFKMIQRDFPNVKFYKVGTELTYEELNNIIR